MATGSRQFTLVVAASNSVGRLQADFICDGVSDQITIQNALDVLQEQGGGCLQLLEGTYWLDTQGIKPQGRQLRLLELDSDNIMLRGLGAATCLCLDQAALPQLVDLGCPVCQLLYVGGRNFQLLDLVLDGGCDAALQANLRAATQGSAAQCLPMTCGLRLGMTAEDARLRNLILRNCSYIAVDSLAAASSLCDCQVVNCSCGLYLSGPQPLVSQCRLQGCDTSVYAEGSGLLAQACFISQDSGCGIYCFNSSHVLLRGNLFRGVAQPVCLSHCQQVVEQDNISY